MGIDLAKLTPAPWHVIKRVHEDAEPGECFVKFTGEDDLSSDSTMMDVAHAEFIALARNDFDVKMRRKWSTVYMPNTDEWTIPELQQVAGRWPTHVIEVLQ